MQEQEGESGPFQRTKANGGPQVHVVVWDLGNANQLAHQSDHQRNPHQVPDEGNQSHLGKSQHHRRPLI